MGPEDLFLDTLEDLRRRSDLRASEYDMVQVAGLVRRLLLDGQRLWVEANKAYRMRPVCSWSTVVITAGTYEGATACISMHWLDPMLEDLILDLRLPSGVARESLVPPQTGNLDAFLRYRVAVAGELGVTASQLVTHYANREGGVHYDSTPPILPLLGALRGDHDYALRLTVLAIGRIVHRALEPLAARIVLSRNPHPYGLIS
ncbi:hypothetical protein AB0K35_26135 [Micromonospora sp. NPDC053740]|uniref:hypothetical protein n=1 Tax=Micromonospora sp. NPDC053740 TaxID=3155173 RepID=UPI003446F6BC